MLRKNVFRSRQVPAHTRLQTFRTLIQSKILYGAGAWQAMNLHTVAYFITQMMSHIRMLVPEVTPGPGVMRLDVLANAGIEHPLMMLSQKRLSLFDRLCRTEMTELFAILQNQTDKGAWFSQVQFDLSQLQLLVPDGPVADLLPASDTFELAHFTSCHANAFTRFGKIAHKRYCLYLNIWKRFRQFQQDFQEILLAAGATIDMVHPEPHPTSGYQCDQCGHSFLSFKALCSHTHKQHGDVNAAQRYAIGCMCRGCLRVFDSRTQLVHHLKYYRTGCLVKLISCVEPLSDDELQEALAAQHASQPAQKSQARKKRRRHPVTQAAGPQRPWPWMRTIQWVTHGDMPHHSLDDPELYHWTQRVLQDLDAGSELALFHTFMQVAYHPALARHVTEVFSSGLFLPHMMKWFSMPHCKRPFSCGKIATWSLRSHPVCPSLLKSLASLFNRFAFQFSHPTMLLRMQTLVNERSSMSIGLNLMSYINFVSNWI